MNSRILDHLCSHCALTLSPAEKQSMVSDLTSILKFVDQIHHVPTEGIVPLTHLIIPEQMDVWDEPETTKGNDLYKVETKENTDDFYVVPKVIEP